MNAPTPTEIADAVGKLRDIGASSVTVRVSRGGTLEVIATWPDDQKPQRAAIRPR